MHGRPKGKGHQQSTVPQSNTIQLVTQPPAVPSLSEAVTLKSFSNISWDADPSHSEKLVTGSYPTLLITTFFAMIMQEIQVLPLHSLQVINHLGGTRKMCKLSLLSTSLNMMISMQSYMYCILKISHPLWAINQQCKCLLTFGSTL